MQQEPKACFRNRISVPKTDGLSGAGHQRSDDGGSDTASIASAVVVGKPWKKHHNRHKKEKTRRVMPGYYA